MYMKLVFHVFIYICTIAHGHRKFDKRDLVNLREEVRHMFQHAYEGYLKYAYPYDELRPLSCDGIDTWGSYSLTLIDALDTLAVMGNYSEFQRVVEIVKNRANFDANINVSVFETNIRIIGGLLSAHLLSHRAGVPLEPGWPCNGPLLRLAEDVARRLLAAFDTTTGMPYGTVNLRHGIPEGETSVTCTAGIGTFILEMGTLSRLTGDPVFEEVAMNALYALYNHRSTIGLVGNHIDVETGRWTAKDSGIGAGVDSYYEYLAKGALLLQRPELMHMFEEGKQAIEKYLKRDDWHMWVSMSKGQVTLPVFQSLEAYWPGVLSLVGDINKAMKTLHNYHQVWKQYGFTPEYYNILQGEAGSNREGYPLRPELVESVMYLYRATGDPYLLEVGKDILRSIQHSAKTSCGYATIKDVRDHRKEDRMESFFLAETTKYLYLLFDPENFIHNRGQHGKVIHMPWGECIIEAGGYIFNTEAHPIDPGALHCCSGHRKSDVLKILRTTDPQVIQGERLSTLRNRSFFSRTTREHKPVLVNLSSNSSYSPDEQEKSEEEKDREEFLRELLSEVAATLHPDALEEKTDPLEIDDKSVQQFKDAIKRVREKRDKQKNKNFNGHNILQENNGGNSDDIIVPVKQSDQVEKVSILKPNNNEKLSKPNGGDELTDIPKKIDEVLKAVKEVISPIRNEVSDLSAILNNLRENNNNIRAASEVVPLNSYLHTKENEDINSLNNNMENQFVSSVNSKKIEKTVTVNSEMMEKNVIQDISANEETVYPNEKSAEETQSMNNGDNERQSTSNGDNERQTMNNGDNDRQSINSGDNERQSMSNGDNERQSMNNGDNERQSMNNGDNEMQSMSNGDNERQSMNNGDNERQSVNNGDNERQSMNNGNNERQSMSNGDNERQSVNNRDNEMQSMNNGDNERQSMNNGDNETQSMNNGDNERQSVNNGDNESTASSSDSNGGNLEWNDDISVDDFIEFNIEEDSVNEVKIADKEDILEYQADDSDRVYKAKDTISIELEGTVSEEGENDVGSISGGIKKEEEFTSVRQVSHKAQNINQLPKFPFFPSFFTDVFLSKMTPRVVFDPQVLSEKLLHQPKYKRNTFWEQNYEILTCPAQPFLQRISISGELYNS